jgi:hypothetical protein
VFTDRFPFAEEITLFLPENFQRPVGTTREKSFDDTPTIRQAIPMESVNQPKAIAPWPFCENIESDLVLISSDDMYFYIHKLVLSLVSPVFNTMLTLPLEQLQEVHDGRPCVRLPDRGTSLQLLLSWCDPRCSHRSIDLNDLQLVLELADKYDTECITKRLETVMIRMKDVISTHPVLMYAIAARFRLEKLARAAAKETLKVAFKDLVSNFVPETRYISGLCFQNLLQYHRTCAAAAAYLATNFDWLERGDDPDLIFFVSACEGGACLIESRSGFGWLKWWLEYMDAVAELVDAAPSSSVDDVVFLQGFHTKISRGKCYNCHKLGHEELVVFARRLSVEVERRISSVR